MYCIKFIIFELSTLTILADIKPLKLDTEIVKNSGIDVAYPAILPIVFGFKFKFSANFLNAVTKIYFEIKTITHEYIINFTNSIIMLFHHPILIIFIILMYFIF